MLNRVRALFQQSAKLESSATILRKNGRRGTKATTTTTVTTTPTNNAGNTNNNSNNSSNNNNNNNSNKWGQYLRTAFFIGIVGYTFGKNALDTNNPNSPINKFLYPNKQGKYALKVERLDDKLSNYKTSWIKAKDGIPSAMASAMRHLNMKRIGLQVKFTFPPIPLTSLNPLINSSLSTLFVLSSFSSSLRLTSYPYLINKSEIFLPLVNLIKKRS